MNRYQSISKHLNIIKNDETNLKYKKRGSKDKRNKFETLFRKMNRRTIDEYNISEIPNKTGRVFSKGFEEDITTLKSNENHNVNKRFYSRKNKYFKRKSTFFGKNIGIKVFVFIILLLSILKGQILFNKIYSIYKIFWNNINYTKVHIALNIDNKYIYPSIVFMTSLLENRNYNTFYDMYILISPDLTTDYKDKVNILINKYGDKVLNISYINMGNDFDGALSGPYISTAAYYRIALPSLLPSIEKIIYCDADVLAFKDLTKMYNLELKDNIYMMGALDFASMRDELNQIGISSDRYMNSGILLMNLKSMRINGVEKKIRDFIDKNFLNHHDQTAINGVCLNNWDILPIRYSSFDYDNYTEIIQYNNEQDQKYRYNTNELNNAFYNPTLIHFAGWVKPWHQECTKSKRYIWWYYAKKSGFYDEILNNYQFNKTQVERELKAISYRSFLIKRI